MPDQITTEEFADHMDAFEQRLGARASRSDRRIEAIDSRLDAIDGRLDTIDTRLDVIDGRLRGLVEAIEGRLVERDEGGRRLEGVDAESMSMSTTARCDNANGVKVDRPKPTRTRETPRAPRASDGPAKRVRQRRSRT